MAQAVRRAWNASRHWLATGFLACTILFLLLMFMNWQNEHRGIALQKATGLTSISMESASAWHQKSILPWSSNRTARTIRPGLRQRIGRRYDWRRARKRARKCPVGSKWFATGHATGKYRADGSSYRDARNHRR